MTKSTFQFDFKDLKIDGSNVETITGFNEGEDRGFVNDLIEEVLKESEQVCRVKAEYIIYPAVKFSSTDKSIEVNNVNFNIKKIVFGQIKKSDSIALFLCTAGEEIGIKSRKAMLERDMLKGYIYDVVGSLIVEAAADLMQNALEKSVRSEGKKITNRYNPGYCGWDVAEQHKLFQLLPDNYCRISLTESALMNPVKSLSGIIGIGENVRSNPYTCQICDMKDCIYRKIKDKR